MESELKWCNCQAIEGATNYPGPWHPRGDVTCVHATEESVRLIDEICGVREFDSSR